MESIVDTSDEWIKSRTGIEQRRILKGNVGLSFMAVKAVQSLLEKSGTNPEDIELLIVQLSPVIMFFLLLLILFAAKLEQLTPLGMI